MTDEEYRQPNRIQCAPCSSARLLRIPFVLTVFTSMAASLVCLYLKTSRPLFYVFLIPFDLTVIAYLHVVFVDPGTPPSSWAATRKDYPVCSRSGHQKPPRSHFDSVTQRLVLNMDHFCPWVDNCVGFYNKKFFLLFLVYATISSIYSVVVLAPIALRSQDTMHLVDWMVYAVVLKDGFCGAIFGLFGGAHVYLVLRNKTTIEATSNEFDRGCLANTKQVLGRWVLTWWIPLNLCGPEGNGVFWQQSDGTWVGVADQPDQGLEMLEVGGRA